MVQRLLEEIQKKNSLINNLIKEVEVVNREKSEQEINFQKILKEIRNPQLNNHSREFYIMNQDLKHFKVLIYSIKFNI